MKSNHLRLPTAPGTAYTVPPLGPAPGEEWWGLGLCREMDPESFFIEKGSSARPAKRACSRCPVQQQCAEYALENTDLLGIWGGMTEKDRKNIRRTIRAAEQAAAVEPQAVAA